MTHFIVKLKLYVLEKSLVFVVWLIVRSFVLYVGNTVKNFTDNWQFVFDIDDGHSSDIGIDDVYYYTWNKQDKIFETFEYDSDVLCNVFVVWVIEMHNECFRESILLLIFMKLKKWG